MGSITDSNILSQAKKGQGETNQRLEAIAAKLDQTNELLAQLVASLSQQA
jgi:hypothetical protein